MNISLTIKKTIKRFIGKLVSKLIKPKKVIIPPAPPAISQPEPRQFQPPPPQPLPPQPSPQNPMVSFFTRLGKSAIGKAVKPLATKLSLAAIPEPIISKALLLLSFAKDVLSFAKRGLKKLINKPPLALATGLTLIGLPILVPMAPAAGIILTGAGIATTITGLAGGATKLVGGITGRAAGFLSGAAGTVGGLFSGLTTISLPAVLPLVGVIGAIGAVVLITVITVMTVGGAFQKGQGGQIPNLGNPVVAQAPSPTSQLGETVIWILNQCGITAVNKSTWARTEDCLRSSTLTNKEAIIAQFHFSVFEVGPGLQCVGFIRGVMVALGKDPGGNRDAKDYLNPPPPPGYQPINTNMQMVQKGDLVIMRGTQFGHIGIVVERTGDSIKVAQAWGTANGLLQITEINPVYFDGFLRPL